MSGMADETTRLLLEVLGKDRGAKKTLKDVGAAAEDASDEARGLSERFKDSADDAKTLDGEIQRTERSIVELAKAIEQSPDELPLFRELNKQQSALRRLKRVKDLLPGEKEGQESGEAVSRGMVSRVVAGAVGASAKVGSGLASKVPGALGDAVSNLPPQAQAAIGAGVVGAIAVTAPLIGATLAGAVVGAAGIGGVVGGLVIASKHPAVKKAAGDLGDDVSGILQRSTISFVPAATEALGMVRTEIHSWEPQLTQIFANSSRYVRPLTAALLDAGGSLLDGIDDAVREAGPVIDVLGEGIRRIGDATGDFLSNMSKHATEGAHALALFLYVVEGTIRTVDLAVGSLATMYGLLEKLAGIALPGNVSGLIGLNLQDRKSVV